MISENNLVDGKDSPSPTSLFRQRSTVHDVAPGLGTGMLDQNNEPLFDGDSVLTFNLPWLPDGERGVIRRVTWHSGARSYEGWVVKSENTIAGITPAFSSGKCGVRKFKDSPSPPCSDSDPSVPGTPSIPVKTPNLASVQARWEKDRQCMEAQEREIEREVEGEEATLP